MPDICNPPLQPHPPTSRFPGQALLLNEKGSVLAWGLGLYYMIFGFMGKYLQIPGVSAPFPSLGKGRGWGLLLHHHLFNGL